MAEDKLFFVGQKAFINKNGKLLVLRDPDYAVDGDVGLDFPGGKIQIGELDLPEALRREVREETSLEIEIRELFVTWYNEFPEHHRNAGKKVFFVGYRCKYKSGDVTLSHEHNSYRWVNRNDYHEVDDKSKFFDALEQYFCKTQ